MFVRKKKNISGVISVQVIDKSTGKYRVAKTIGSSSDVQTVEDLYFQGKKWILQQKCEQNMVLELTCKIEEKVVVENLLNNRHVLYHHTTV